MIRSISIILTRRLQAPNDHSALRLASLAARLEAFSRRPVTWGVGSEGIVLSVVPEHGVATVEEEFEAFLTQFEAEAHELGYRMAKDVSRS